MSDRRSEPIIVLQQICPGQAITISLIADNFPRFALTG